MKNIILSNFKIREPILREELKLLLKIEDNNAFNKHISSLLKTGVIKSFEKGIYYIPEKEMRFRDLKPSLVDVIEKKYCVNYTGFRTGAALLNRFKLTTQVSSSYEILTSKVSKDARNRKVLNGKVKVSASKIPINKQSYYYIIFAELLKNIEYSDYKEEENIGLLNTIFNKFMLDKNKMLNVLEYYKGNRLSYMHILFTKLNTPLSS